MGLWKYLMRFPGRSLRLVTWGALALGAAAGAADTAALLEQARQAWQKGDEFGEQARTALRASKPARDPFDLLDAQKAACQSAETFYLEARKQAPGERRVEADFGRFLAAQRRYPEARPYLAAAVAEPQAGEAPRPHLDPAPRAQALQALGSLCERAGQARRAVDCYRQAHDLAPQDPRPRLSLAVAQCAVGEPEAALPLLTPWVESAAAGGVSSSDRALAFYTLAYAQEETGNPEVALTTYQQAREAALDAGAAETRGVASQARQALERLGVMLNEFKKDDELAAKARAEREKPEAQRLPVEESHALRQRLTMAVSLCEKGVHLKRKALQDPAAFQKAAVALADTQTEPEAAALRNAAPLNTFYQALRDFQEARNACPRFSRASRELGLCHVALGEFDAARAALDTAAAFDPLNPGMLAAQGEVRLLVEDWPAAKETFARLVQVDPENGAGHLGVARALVRRHFSKSELQDALDAAGRAADLGVSPKAVEPVRAEAADMLARLARGERLPPAPSRRKPGERARPAGTAPFEPWRGTILEQ